MKKIFTVLLCFVFVVSFVDGVYSQDRSSISIYGALSLPTGDFSDDEGSDAGFAKLGYGGGIEFAKPVVSSGLYWVTGVSAITNPLDVKGISMEVFDDDDMEDHFDIKNHLNIPIVTGLQYRTTVETFDLFLSGQIGLNINRMGDWTLSDVYYMGYPVDEITYEFETTNSFAFIIGGGLIFGDKFIVGARYYGLGEIEIEDATVTVDGDEMDWSDAENDHQISMFVFNVGLNFSL